MPEYIPAIENSMLEFLLKKAKEGKEKKDDNKKEARRPGKLRAQHVSKDTAYFTT